MSKGNRALALVRGAGGLCVWACLALAPAPGAAQAGGGPGAIPSFEALEDAGAVIGEIRVVTQNVFDLSDPRENKLFYRAGNALHVPTRESVIRRALLFRSGERVSAQLIDETERLLRSYGFIYDVRIRATAYANGRVDLEVMTRDSWTLDPSIKLSREGGSSTSGIGLKENNLLGTGVSVGFAREDDVDRNGTEYSIAHPHAFGGRTAIEYSHSDFNDGVRDTFKFDRPFYALDTRWAAGVIATRHTRIDSIFNGGLVAGQYRREAEQGEAYGGLSRGLIDGWVQRYSAGIEYRNDAYSRDPLLIAPVTLPSDQKLVAPFVRYEVVEDDFRKVRNLDLVGRTEYLDMGFSALVKVGRSLEALGSTEELWLYDARASNGFELAPGRDLLASVYARGQYGSAGGERQFFGAESRYYQRRPGGQVLFASASADAIANGGTADQLLLGGDSGLRGYPLRYQSGTRRALFTLEQRFYTEWYPFRLFRVGAAVFFDHGRAWGGPNRNAANPGWLSNVGVGLRIFSDRSATGRVMHIDLAFPLDSDPAIKSRQIIFKSRASF